MTFSGPIGGLIDFAIGGGWGSDAPKDKYSRVAVIRGTDIPKVAAGDFSTVPIRFESDKKVANRLLAVGDLVLETAGGSSANGQYTGRTLLVTQEILDAFGPTICASFCKKIVLRKELVNPTYFYFYMQDLYKSGRVAAYDSQSTGISNFQYEAFLNNENLDLPLLKIQEYIAATLQDLQNTINIKSKISNTLEAIAQTIFRSWFIDFEPVKAKTLGQKPLATDEETASLFPDSMEKSDLGMIPKGWEVQRFGDLVVKQKVGRVYSSKESIGNGRVPILDQKDSGKVGFHNESPGYIATPDQPVVVFGNHTCVLRLIPYEFSVIQNVFPLLSDHADTFWLYFVLQGKQDYEGYKGHWPDFVLHQIPVPPKELTAKFGENAKALFQLRWSLNNQMASLETVKDALLPRLISGELRFPEETLAQ